MIASLDELVLECVDESARTHIGEAVKCYQGGAYRAAIVAAYVSVSFDLIQKLRVLAAADDPEARDADAKLRALQAQDDKGDPNAIKGLLEFERGLLESFRDKFDFFGRNEFDELDRLRTDRNRCAHPTFLKSELPFTPSAELARLHIRNALALVLTQHPRQGKAALNSLQSVVLSSYFPNNTTDAVARLRGTELKNARAVLIRAFVDQLCFGHPDTSSPYYKKAATRVAIDAALEMHRAEVLPRLINNMNKLLKSTEPSCVEFGCIVALRVIEAGEVTDDAGKAVLKSWIGKAHKGVSRANTISRGLLIGWLRDSAVNAISSLTSEELGEISVKVEPEILSHAAMMFGSATSWSQANSYASDFAIKFAEIFSEEELELIFSRAVSGADLRGSHGFDEFIDALSSEDEKRNVLVDGLLKKYGLSG